MLDLVVRADHLVAMTGSHLAALADRLPPDGPATRLLRRDGLDLPDPIGGGPEDYRSCARTIREHLGPFVAEVIGP
jgi:protein-tyrosine-phosphatase